MGKKLIIKGADFSANGLFAGADLTSSFSWTDGVFNSVVNETSSSAFKKSNSVSVSEYVGKTMKVAFCNFTTSSGSRSSYGGLFFMDGNGDIIEGSGLRMEKGTGDNGKGNSVDKEITIPEGAATFKTSYLKDSYFNGDPVPFYCRILPD